MKDKGLHEIYNELIGKQHIHYVYLWLIIFCKLGISHKDLGFY